MSADRPSDDTWACEAYGPDGAELGALCFVAEPGQRHCADQHECAQTLAAERRRVYRRIQELSTAPGEAGEAGAYLEAMFTSPDQLLGGPGDPPDDDAEYE